MSIDPIYNRWGYLQAVTMNSATNVQEYCYPATFLLKAHIINDCLAKNSSNSFSISTLQSRLRPAFTGTRSQGKLINITLERVEILSISGYSLMRVSACLQEHTLPFWVLILASPIESTIISW